MADRVSRPRTQGVGAAIYAVASDWITRAQIRQALAGTLSADTVDKSIANMASRKQLQVHPDGGTPTRYRANPATPVAARSGPHSKTTVASTYVPEEAVAPASAPVMHFEPSMSVSLGVLCNTRPPANPAQGRIEDALASVLDRTDWTPLDQLLAAIPGGWSRIDVIAGLADAVIDGWVVGNAAERRQQGYRLLKDPPAKRVDPLAEKFRSSKLLERCESLGIELVDILADCRDRDAPPELVRALDDLRRSAANTARQLAG